MIELRKPQLYLERALRRKPLTLQMEFMFFDRFVSEFNPTKFIADMLIRIKQIHFYWLFLLTYAALLMASFCGDNKIPFGIEIYKDG
jgi:hypothetical protein